MDIQKTAIVFCVEQGILEEQAVLLSKSIHQFLNDEYQVIAISPREQNYISPRVEKELLELNVNVIKTNINLDYGHYPVANKLLAMKYIENNFDFHNLIFVDTDTVFLNSIDINLIKKQILLRPVDNKGPGTEGKKDLNDNFWLKIFDLFSMPPPEAKMITTVGQETIRNYYNAGFIWVAGINGFYQQWYDDFLKIISSELRPYGYQSRDGDDFRCLDQVALSVTAERYKNHINVLPATYNYPMPFKPILQKRNNQSLLNDLIHVHYHKWFQHPGFLNHVTSADEKESYQYNWLQQRLPLQPVISEKFKC